ncbi:hypothetical protein ACFL5Z_04270 [Planctomycetota bacterium]
MDITIVKKEETLCLTWNAVKAQINISEIKLAHMGCKLLGTLTNIPHDLQSQWNHEFGGNWKSKKDSKLKLARALQDALNQSQMNGAVLWDTMRTGSDYWRPGKLILDTVELLPARLQNNISYAREDIFCPPRDLLKQFINDENMSFGQYAAEYSRYLNVEGSLPLATASVILNLAQGRLPIIYCVDPYIPHYLRTGEFCSAIQYDRRHWLDDLRFDGCHRVILAEEIVRAFLAYGVHTTLFELDSTFQKAHCRTIHPYSTHLL